MLFALPDIAGEAHGCESQLPIARERKPMPTRQTKKKHGTAKAFHSPPEISPSQYRKPVRPAKVSQPRAIASGKLGRESCLYYGRPTVASARPWRISTLAKALTSHSFLPGSSRRRRKTKACRNYGAVLLLRRSHRPGFLPQVVDRTLGTCRWTLVSNAAYPNRIRR